MGDDAASAPEMTEISPVGGSFAGEEPRKRPKVFVHWARPKSSLYEYNYDYGRNYYSSMIDYLDQRARGGRPEAPKPLFWEERALRSYLDRSARASSLRHNRDTELLQALRSSSSHYIAHTKTYARKVTVGF